MFLANLFRRRGLTDAAHSLYGAAVARAREPVFYRDLDVADTIEGRFEMISLHVFLVLRRLKGRASADSDSGLAQAVFDLMFADMDQSLREIGVGDLSVGRKVKALAQAFYGRIAAYDMGVEAGSDGILEAALQRNVYAGRTDDRARECAAALALYTRANVTALQALPVESITRGEVAFAPPPQGLPEASPAAAGESERAS